MSDTIKAAKIGAVATIIVAVIGSLTVFLTNNDSPTEKIAKNSNGNQNAIVQNSQHVTISYENKKDNYQKDILNNESKPEDNLNKIFIGANERYLESIFGIPVVTNKITSINSKEVFYSFERFYLQFLYDKDGGVFFYSVTSKDINFHPEIPKLGSMLGIGTFKDISKEENGNIYDATHLYSYLTSKHYGYGEYIYLGNGGNYHNYYLAYNSAGVNYDSWDNVVTYVNGYEEQNIEKFRSVMKPNSFGVGDMKGVSNDNLIYEVGVEFYTFRNEKLILTKSSS